MQLYVELADAWTPLQHFAAEMLANLLFDPYFDALRTRWGVAYTPSVSFQHYPALSGAFFTEDRRGGFPRESIGLLFSVASSKYDLVGVLEKIFQFLRSFLEAGEMAKLLGLGGGSEVGADTTRALLTSGPTASPSLSEKFYATKSSLVRELDEESPNLRDFATDLWWEIAVSSSSAPPDRCSPGGLRPPGEQRSGGAQPKFDRSREISRAVSGTDVDEVLRSTISEMASSVLRGDGLAVLAGVSPAGVVQEQLRGLQTLVSREFVGKSIEVVER